MYLVVVHVYMVCNYVTVSCVLASYRGRRYEGVSSDLDGFTHFQ